MENTPLVSVIVPIYNVECYLEQCIISIVHQTYKNLEIILVNDGSPDNSLEICNKWASRDRRIKVIDKENGGLSDARNAGLRVAKGEYVAFVDSDDWISINMVEDTLREMLKNNADLVVFNYVSAYESGYMEKSSKGTSSITMNKEEYLRLVLEDRIITSHVWRRLYKRSLLPTDVFPKGKTFEDIYVSVPTVNNCKKIVFMDDFYYFYRINNEGIVRTVTIDNCRNHFAALKKRYDDICINYPELEVVAAKSFRYSLVTAIWPKLYRLDDSSQKRQLQSEIKLMLQKKSFRKSRSIKELILTLEIFVGLPLKFVREEICKNNFVKRILKSLFNYPKQRKVVRKLSSRGKNFFIIASPRYGNLGDLALLEGEKKFIGKFFSDYTLKEITFQQLSSLNKKVNPKNPNNIYAIQAGGNMGTLYPGVHCIQESFLRNMQKANLMVFPQTFYYDFSQDNCDNFLSKSSELYNSKKIQVFVRDAASYNFFQKNIEENNISLVPDIALMLDGKSYSKKIENRQGVFLCLRNDIERTLSNSELDEIYSTLESYFGSKITQGDTHRYDDNVDDETFKYVESLLNIIGSKRMMLTDRLHGMIFAAITSTPCVVITSRSPKVKGVYKWIKYLPYIKLVEDVKQLDEAIKEVLNIRNPLFNNKQLMVEFEKMANSIRENFGVSNE